MISESSGDYLRSWRALGPRAALCLLRSQKPANVRKLAGIQNIEMVVFFSIDGEGYEFLVYLGL